MRNPHQANTVCRRQTTLRLASGFRECAARKPHSDAGPALSRSTRERERPNQLTWCRAVLSSPGRLERDWCRSAMSKTFRSKSKMLASVITMSKYNVNRQQVEIQYKSSKTGLTKFGDVENGMC